MTGTDASTWTWSYVGEFGTAADAGTLAKAESLNYTYFTGAQFTQLANGSLALVVSPTSSVIRPGNRLRGGERDVVDSGPAAIGCRVLPLASLTTPALTVDASTGAATVLARVDNATSADSLGVESSFNSCAYDPATALGVVAGEFAIEQESVAFGLAQDQLVYTKLKP